MPHQPKRRACLEPTPHLEVAKQYAADSGLAILTGVLDKEELARVREAVWRTVEADRAAGVQLTGHTRIDPDENNIRLFGLVVKDPVFRELLEHPAAIALATHLLGPKIRLSNFSANITGPGSGAMGMHADQGYVTPPWPSWPMAVNIMWIIDAFTAENGATRVMPDSKDYGHGPEWGLDYPEAVPLICPAGSIVAMDARIWHQTGANTTKDVRRIGMFAYYVRPFILPQIDWGELVLPELRASITPGLHEMLSFGSRATRHLQTRHGRQIWLDDPALEL
jgi:ectoine hydroxylase-related dioxygenase (phytanoyl-CoA dioxygenase family)